MFLFLLSLQEYIQAEKKKNSKTSSTKEGKALSSSVQIDGKSTEVLALHRFMSSVPNSKTSLVIPYIET